MAETATQSPARSADDIKRDPLIADAAARVGDAITDAKEFAGVYYISFFLPTRPPNGAARDFVADFEHRYGMPPDQRAALAYDAAMLIGRAVLAIGPDRKKVRDHVAGIGRLSPAVTGVRGPIAFDDEQDVVNKPVVIARVGGR